MCTSACGARFISLRNIKRKGRRIAWRAERLGLKFQAQDAEDLKFNEIENKL